MLPDDFLEFRLKKQTKKQQQITSLSRATRMSQLFQVNFPLIVCI